jgi:hypothetical protein
MAGEPRKRRRRWWLALLLALLLLGGPLLALPYLVEIPWLRERVRVVVNDALSPLFMGRIELERLGHIGLGGVRGVDARIFDAQGKQVIRVQGLTALAWLPGLAWQVIVHGDAPELAIATVQVDHADVQLREDEELGVTLARAFMPRESEPDVPAASSAEPRITIARVRLERVWVHGRVAGSPALDAELLQVRASLAQSSAEGFTLDLDGLQLVTRGMPGAVDPRGTVVGRLEVPQAEPRPMRIEATLEGRALDSPLSVDASWVGDALFARLDLSRVPAAELKARVPDLSLAGDVALSATVDGTLPALDFWADLDARAGHARAEGSVITSGGLELIASVQAADVDLSGVMQGAPPSQLAMSMRGVLFEREDGYFVGAERVELAPGMVDGQMTPGAWLAGTSELSAAGALRALGRLGVDEAGVSARGRYSLALSEQQRGRVTVALDADVDEPARLAQWGVGAAGKLELSADYEPDSGRLTGKSALTLSHLDYRQLGARNVELRARASGTLQDPRLHAATTLDLLSGRAHADLDYSSLATRLELFAADLDLLRFSRAFGLQVPLHQGSLSLELALCREAPSKSFELDGNARADLGKVGVVRASARGFELPELSGAAPTLTRGEVGVSGNLDLSELAPLWVASGLPIERTTGKVRFELAAARGPGAAGGLEISALVDTAGLRVIEQRQVPQSFQTTADAQAGVPLAVEGIDLRLSLHVQPERGDAFGTLILRDQGGTLAEAQAETSLKGVWPNRLGEVARLRALPLRIMLEVPTRKLGSLPPVLRPAALRGRIAVRAELAGSIAEPHAEAWLTLQSLRASGSKDPVDIETQLAYTPTAGRLEARAKVARTGAQALDLNASWQGDLQRAFASAAGHPPVTGSVTARLDGLPLDIVPMLVDRQLNGRLSGELKLEDWGRDARLDAHLHSSSLTLGQLAIERLDVTAKSDARRLALALGLDAGGGTTLASLDAGMRWGARPLPELEHQGVAKLSTRGFRLEALMPFIGSSVSEVGGLLDATTEISVTPTTTTLEGEARLEKGVLQIPALGQRFSDIRARVAVRDNQFQLEQLDARGTTGKVSVTGRARLDGFELRNAEAKATIAEREKLPITLEGQALGEAWGHVGVAYSSPAEGARRLSVDVPDFHLVMPPNSGSGLQSLDESEEIRVGVHRADGKFVPLAVQPLEPGGKGEGGATPSRPLVVEIALGNVVIDRDRSVTAQLTGHLQLQAADTTQLTGRIEVRGGRLDVQGKRFEIERGVVTFDGGDPGNPTITATARWDAPDYSVYADYVGDVKTGRIKLRAEPPLTQDQIASLLLFGSPEGSAGGGDSSTASLAVSVAGDTAAQGLNHALDKLTNLDVSARIDTTTGSARPELVFQVSPRVAARVTRAIGAPAAGESPDRTFLTLELRLKRAWALSALVGDRGASALDLIWRRRY